MKSLAPLNKARYRKAETQTFRYSVDSGSDDRRRSERPSSAL